MATARDVARWMSEQIESKKELYQEEAVWEIENLFGSKFVYENENGNPAINRRVLQEFRKLTEQTVLWERGGRFWRFRQAHDDPERRQTE